MILISNAEVRITPKFTSTASPYRHNKNFGLKLHLIKLIKTLNIVFFEIFSQKDEP